MRNPRLKQNELIPKLMAGQRQSSDFRLISFPLQHTDRTSEVEAPHGSSRINYSCECLSGSAFGSGFVGAFLLLLFCFVLHPGLGSFFFFFLPLVKETTFSHILLQRATFESQFESGDTRKRPQCLRSTVASQVISEASVGKEEPRAWDRTLKIPLAIVLWMFKHCETCERR